jgi:hypothetical protein
MKTLLFLTADYANLTQDNKVNILGIFNQVQAARFPTLHPQFALVAKVGLETGEARENRKLSLYFVGQDANQQKVKIMEETFDFPERVGGLDPEHALVLNVQGFVFPQPGTYQFILHIDDRFLASLPIYLTLMPQPPQLPAGG